MKQAYWDCITYEEDFFLQYEYIIKKQSQHILLESGRDARYSIMGVSPVASIVGKNNICTITTEEGEQVIEGNPLYVVRDYMKQHRVENYPKEIPFSGGAMGYISYDYMHYIEEIPCQAVDDLQIPDVAFLF